MKRLRQNITLIFSVFLLVSLPPHSLAQNETPDTYETDDDPCGDVASSGDSTSNNSVRLSFNLGRAPYARPTNYSAAYTALLTYLKDDKQVKNFSGIVNYFEGSEVSNLWNATLRLETNSIDSTTFSPAYLKYQQNHQMEVIKLNGVIRQVLTHDFLVDIQKLPTGQEGFELKWFYATDKGAKGVMIDGVITGLYHLPSGNPVKYVKVSNPSPGTSTTCNVHSETNAPGGLKRIIHHRYVFGTNGSGQTQHRMETWTDEPATSGATEIAEDTLVFLSGAPNSNTQDRIRTVKKADLNASGGYGSLTTVSRVREKYSDIGGKKLMTEMIRLSGTGSDTAGLKTTYGYYDDPNDSMRLGHPRWQKNPDGSWVVWVVTATSSSQTVKEIKPFADGGTFILADDGSNVGGMVESEAMVTQEIITSAERTTIHKALGQTVGQTVSYFLTGSGGERIVRTRHYDNADSYFETYKAYYPYGNGTAVNAGRIAWETNRDGTATTYTYTNGGGGDTMVVRKTGAASGTGSSSPPSITAGTATGTTYNKFWKPYAETLKDIESDLTLSYWLGTDVDLYGRPQRIEYNGQSNDYSTSVYACCGLASQRQRSGAITTYSHDLLQREYLSVTKRSSTGVEIRMSTVRSGLTTTTSVSAGSGGDAIAYDSSKTVANLLGETTERWTADADGDGDLEPTTILTEYPSGGGSKATETNPLGGTRITETYRDGRTGRVHGTAVSNVSYEYGVHTINGGGLTTKEIREASAGGTSEWSETYTDLLGRTIKTAYPDGAEDSMVYYDATADPGKRGQLASVKDADEVAVAGKGTSVTYDYNARGERTITAEAIADNHTRTTVSTHSVVQFTGGSGNNPAIPNDIYRKVETRMNNLLVRTTYTSADGYATYTASPAGLSANVRSVSVDGAWTATSVAPSGQSQKQTHIAGLLEKTESFDNSGTPVLISSTSYTYDAIGRMETATDSRTGATTYSGVTGTGYTPSGSLLGMKDSGARLSSYGYDALGRRVSTTLDNTVTHTSYTAKGEIEAQWGSQTYPTFHTYDEQGRPLTLRTQPTLSGGVPTNAGGSVTTWLYHSLRGWLVEKNYHGETDNGTTDPDYTYTPAGRLATRTWERGVSTAYAYDHGMVETVDYSDATADLDYTYDAFGRVYTVAQGGNLHTYTYVSTTSVVDVETVAYDSDGNGTADFSRTLNRHQDGFLRDAGWELNELNESGGIAATDNSVTYGYSTIGRLETVASAADAFTYGYTYNQTAADPDAEPPVPAGARVGSTSGTKQDFMPYTLTKSGSPVLQTLRTYEASRDVLASIQNIAGGTTRSAYDYSSVNGGVNSLGQRGGVHATFDLGTGFAATSGDTSWGYDSLGQLTSADAPDLPGEGENDPSDPFADRAYQYDTIGNRIFSESGATQIPSTPGANTTIYDANILNQYAGTGAISGALESDPVFDDDGNMKIGPLSGTGGSASNHLYWDGENRLIQVREDNDNTVIASYAYDAQSRRISKTTSAGTTLFIYDGWNCIAEYTGTTISKTRTWGLDLSGTLQGAGGVGGLLTEKQGADTLYPTYDGNGNISEYLTASGTTAAHFEYDPFGNIVRDSYGSGFNASSVTYKFSTKPLDPETGLYYYLYRYYDPATGRWPSRDPLGDEAFFQRYAQEISADGSDKTQELRTQTYGNLYAFLENDGLNNLDKFGLCKCPCVGPWTGNVYGGIVAPIIWAIASFTGNVTCPREDGETNSAMVHVRGGGFGWGASTGQAAIELEADCPENLKGKTDNIWFVGIGPLSGGVNGGSIGGAWIWVHVEDVYY